MGVTVFVAALISITVWGCNSPPMYVIDTPAREPIATAPEPDRPRTTRVTATAPASVSAAPPEPDRPRTTPVAAAVERIAQIDPQDYQLRVQQAEAALAQARARLGLPAAGTNDRVDPEQTNTARQARVLVDEARAHRDRERTLFEQGVIARAQLDTSEASYKVAVSRLDDAREEIHTRQAVLAQRRSELEMARQQLAVERGDTTTQTTPGPSIPKAGTRVEDRPQADLAPPPPLASDVDQFVQKASECAQPDPRKWAIVVGIERYLQGNIPAVPFARHDALIVKEYVRKLLCVPVKNLVFLVDDRATLTQLRLHLDNRLPAWVKEGHTVFFYFVGHGLTADRHPYLVPYDGDPLAPQTSGYAIRALYSSLDRLQGAQVHVYLDACFSGGTRSGEPLLPGGPHPALLEVEDPVLLSHKLVVLTAARGNQLSYSFQEQGHGLFTYYLLKGLMGDAVTVRKQPVTVKALAEYVTQQVSEQARSLFGLESPQEPVLQPTPPRERGEWVLREGR